MNRWWVNISVTYKLCIGFGLVLALIIIITAISWNNAENQADRISKTADVALLEEALMELRIARLNYILSNGDEQQARAVQESLERFAARHREANDVFKTVADGRLLEQLGKQIDAYRDSLQQISNAYRVAGEARQQMLQQSRLLGQQLDEISKSVVNSSAADTATLTQLRTLIHFKDAWQAARFAVRDYVEKINAVGQQAVAAIDLARAEQRPLHDDLGSEQAQRTAQIMAAQDAYRAAFVSYESASNSIANEDKKFVDEGHEILRITQELIGNQLAMGDTENRAALTLQFSAALLALLAGGLAAWQITREIIRPLRETLLAVERIAGGDLSQELIINRKDEIGVLQQGIQRMGSTLRQLIGGIRDGVGHIAVAAEKLSAVTKQTSAGANSQRLETDQVATAVHEMSATVQEVARNAAAASQAASSADREAAEGDRVVNETISQIDRLAAEVNRSQDAMKHLQQESHKIGSVMDVIKSVAEQTNLLALNAAIEAARAGEAGRGFAVVADEVRGLAQRTQKSTEEIEDLVAALQRGTQQVAAIMNSSRGLTDSTVALTRKAGDSLGSITGTVSSIQAMNQQIAAAAEQQSAVAEEINRSVMNVRDISEQTALTSDDTAKASVELAGLGNQLHVMISHFRT
jgi:methyl-accepting chemotaxis protein